MEALRVEWQNSTPRFTSTPERRNENIKKIFHLLDVGGDRTHNQSIFPVTLCAPEPRMASGMFLILVFITV